MDSRYSPIYQFMLRRLKRARRKAGLTQAEVARQLGIPRSRLNRIESGERRLDVGELLTLAKLYRQPITYFVPHW